MVVDCCTLQGGEWPRSEPVDRLVFLFAALRESRSFLHRQRGPDRAQKLEHAPGRVERSFGVLEGRLQARQLDFPGLFFGDKKSGNGTNLGKDLGQLICASMPQGSALLKDDLFTELEILLAEEPPLETRWDAI